MSKSKIILDLCGGTGAWSQPYRDAGYDVRLVTLPDADVRLRMPIGNVHGVLAVPPCTHLAASGARWWKDKGRQPLLDALAVADACMRIVAVEQPAWWALENPVGRLRHYYGDPAFDFHPWEFGDPYTKRTYLWGKFTAPQRQPCEPEITDHKKFTLRDMHRLFPSRMHLLPAGPDRARYPSITPPGFAQAFFKANP